MFSFHKDKKVVGQLFLLCMEGSLDKIMSQVCSTLGVQRKENDPVIVLSGEGIEALRIEGVTKELGEEAEKVLKEQRSGIAGHFRQAPAEKMQDIDRKINVLHQIKRSNGLCGINYVFQGAHAAKMKQELIEKLTGLLSSLQGLLLVTGDKADYLLDASGKIVLDDKGKSQVDRFMPYMDRALIESLKEKAQKEGISEERMKRRSKNREYFESRGIFVPEWYPYIEGISEAKIRSAEEMADRATALLAVSLYSECMLGHGMSTAEARAYAEEHALNRFGGDKVFSPKEKAYFYNDAATEKEKIAYSWQYENLFVMDWALGLVDNLPFPDAICDVPLSVRVLKPFANREELLAAAKPRSGEELLDACDLIFCLDWACVDARVYGLPAPSGMDGGVTQARHKTLNWLVGSDEGAEWDHVGTNT